jgi:hypothetical protein
VTYESTYWPEHWAEMTEFERMQFVAALFDSASPNDIVFQTTEEFCGWNKWYLMRWPNGD